MSNHILLDNITHKNLKVIDSYSPEFGDNVGYTITFPTELGDVQKEYPVLFRQGSEEGQFDMVALFGFVHDENLFLGNNTFFNNNGWQASYVPALVARGPFLIGFQDQSKMGGGEKEPVIHIDMANPRVNETRGQPVFLEHGGSSNYLENINSLMKAIYEGLELSKTMVNIFNQFDLIEPLTVDIELDDGNKYSLQGYYTINEEKLSVLDQKALFTLHQSGFLQAAYLIVNSLGNIRRLIELKNTRIVGNG